MGVLFTGSKIFGTTAQSGTVLIRFAYAEVDHRRDGQAFTTLLTESHHFRIRYRSGRFSASVTDAKLGQALLATCEENFIKSKATEEDDAEDADRVLNDDGSLRDILQTTAAMEVDDIREMFFPSGYDPATIERVSGTFHKD